MPRSDSDNPAPVFFRRTCLVSSGVSQIDLRCMVPLVVLLHIPALVLVANIYLVGLENHMLPPGYIHLVVSETVVFVQNLTYCSGEVGGGGGGGWMML